MSESIAAHPAVFVTLTAPSFGTAIAESHGRLNTTATPQTPPTPPNVQRRGHFMPTHPHRQRRHHAHPECRSTSHARGRFAALGRRERPSQREAHSGVAGSRWV
ncbi:MAG: hypothetical protein ACLP3C_02770 [Mycobacterium sp.]|uniref:hypothetical protein n=1 Tax=Mycobacterium sp. TaxID=1785 RepID=UPI003F9CA6AA